jgi:hypothetical protein
MQTCGFPFHVVPVLDDCPLILEKSIRKNGLWRQWPDQSVAAL